jgi:chemotaxis methyl-accepting protein methylase
VSLEPESTSSPEEEAAFEALCKLILKAYGFDFGQYKANYLKRRVAVRMRAVGVKTFGEYHKILEADRGEWDRLHDRITIHVTEFFRDPEAFQYLETSVLPELAASVVARGDKVFRAWSAGCSTGEEVYSLGILLSETLKGEAARLKLQLEATDIDPACLETGRTAHYDLKAIERVKPDWQARWFRRQPGGIRVAVGDALKAVVRFQRHHLMVDPPLAGMDLILCRNVMIYFTRDQHQKVFEAFHRSLNPGGVLVIGKTESMMGKARELFTCLSARERVYRKIETTA